MEASAFAALGRLLKSCSDPKPEGSRGGLNVDSRSFKAQQLASTVFKETVTVLDSTVDTDLVSRY
jgi:hypothetical protein